WCGRAGRVGFASLLRGAARPNTPSILLYGGTVMATATWVRSELEQQGIPFQEVHHDEAFTAQTVAQREHVSGHRVAKVVVAMADGRPVELILPASRHVLLDRVRRLLGAKDVRLATEPEIERTFTDCEVGAIPALRHWQAEVLMDESMRVAGDI